MANWDAAKDYLKVQRDTLASKSFSELETLDAFSEIPVPETLRPFQVTVSIKRANTDGSLRVVLEAWKGHFFGMWVTKVTEWFVIAPSGARRELAADDYG
jgi:hypothetical protein